MALQSSTVISNILQCTCLFICAFFVHRARYIEGHHIYALLNGSTIRAFESVSREEEEREVLRAVGMGT